MNALPLISIVIPTYNAEGSIFRTLTSIAEQSGSQWECVLIDDGSSDDTIKICTHFIESDKRFRFSSYSPKLKGANACRNVGLDCCSADYVMFIDADDYIAAECIEMRIKALSENSGYEMIIFKTAVINDKGIITGKFSYSDPSLKGLISDFIRHKIPWQTMSPIWKKTFLLSIGGWDESYRRLQDVELAIRALFNRPKYLLMNTAVDSFYRATEMTNEKKYFALYGFIYLIRDHFEKILNDDYWKRYEEEITNSFSVLINGIIPFYLNNFEEAQSEWEEMFIEILRKAEMDDEDLSYLNHLFNTFRKCDKKEPE